MLKIVIWDEKSPINGVSAEEILENRQDLASARGDIFLVSNEHDLVSEIQIGKVIASNYNLKAGLSLQEIGEAYLIKRAEEEELVRQEFISTEELQQEVALLSYELMVVQSTLNKNAVRGVLARQSQSPKFNLIKKWYIKGYWNKGMVQHAVECGEITEEEYHNIVK